MASKKDQKENVGRSLDEFKAEYDESYIVPRKIEAALGKLGDSWVTETEFLRLAEINHTMLGRYREQFTDYVVEVRRKGDRKRVWCGSVEFADQLREMAG